MPIDPEALIAASRAAPRLPPSVLYGAASTPDPVTNAQATSAFGDVTKRVSTMKGQDASVQRSIWASLDPEQQRQFASAGYGGPPAPKHSLLGGVAGAVGHAVGDVFSVPAHAVGEVLHVAGSPLRQLQHAFRAGARLSEGEAMGGAVAGAVAGGYLGSVVPVLGTAIGAGLGAFIGGAVLPLINGPGEWADSWAKTEHGEATFMPDVERRVQRDFGDDTYNLAVQLAGGKGQEEILGAVPEAERQALAERMRDDKDLHQAVTALSDGKISMGRLLVSNLGMHPSEGVGKVLSGATDGVADWFGDPLMAVGKASKASKLLRYGARTGEDVERLYQTRPAVKAAFEDVAGYLGRHADEVEAAGGHAALSEKVASGEAGASAIGELVQRHPTLAPVVQQLVAENITTADELKDWMKGQKGFEQLLRGQVTGAAKEALYKGEARILLPTLTSAGETGLAAKATLKKAIDFTAEADNRFVRGFGRFGRMATTLTPRGHEFDINGDDAVTTIQRVAAYILPDARVKDYVGAWTAADTAGKRTLFKGLLGEVFDHAGVNDTEEGRQWAQHFLETTEADAKSRAYAAGGKDVVNLPSGPSATGFLEGHLQETWSLPSYKALWAQGKRVGAGKVLEGTFNHDMLDHFMQNTWKPLSLLRIGFPLRSGGEELVASIMREGPVGIGRGAAARSALKRELPGAQAGTHFLPRIWNRLTSEMTPEEIEAIKTPGDFVGRVFGNRASRGMAKVEGALAGDEYMNAARELYERGTLGGPFAREISAIHGRGVGYHWDTESMNKINREGARVRGMVIRPTGEFKDYAPTEQHFEQIWRRNLEELGDSNLGKIALRNIDDRETAVNELVDHLESDGFAKERAKATRSRFLRDGRSVTAGEATDHEASIDWANTIFDHAEATVRAPEAGEHITIEGKNLAQRALDGDLPTGKQLGDLGLDMRPAGLKGPVVVAEHQSHVSAIVDKGFARVVGPMMDWMVREPLFIHNYATSKQEVAGLRRMWLTAEELRRVEKTEAQAAKIGEKEYAKVMAGGPRPGVPGAIGEPVAEGLPALYHGTPRPITGGELDTTGAFDRGASNLFGHGFYTTSSPDIAESYIRKGARAGDQPATYHIKWKGDAPPKVLDLEQPIPNDVAEVFRRNLGDESHVAQYLSEDDVAEMHRLLDSGASTSDVYRKFRAAMADSGEVRKSAADEIIADINDAISRSGYDALRYQGGKYAARGQGELHDAYIWLDQSKVGISQRVSGVPGETAEAHLSRAEEARRAATEAHKAQAGIPDLTAQADAHLHDVAVDRAINKTIPYIHDPRMRSQMHVVGRNMMPFQFAQEQFFKRWVNIFKHSPEAFREAQLTMNGIRNMGMIHTDENGNDYFMYPAVAPLQNVLIKGFNAFTGHNASIPLPLNFSGQVRFATPGLERLGLPSFGPLVSLPVTYLTNRFPELNPVAENVLGERGSGRPLWEQLVPTTLSRAIHAISDTADNPGQMHSATMQAMAYLEANGHGLADDATPAEKEAWMDRVKNWARVVMVTRTLYGYAAPAAPEAVFDPSNLHEEFTKLLSSMPIDEAVGTFLKAHPDATPYTIFQTKSASGAPLPATADALKYMEDNREFLDAYPQAGGWFLPQKDEGGQFSMPAYREQMAMEMRKSKTLDEYYRNIKFAEAADTYFDTRDHKDALLKGAQGPQAAQIRQKWATWKDSYMTAHPIFAEELLSSDGQIRRGQTLDQLRLAVNDDRMPKTPQTEAMGHLIQGWDMFQRNKGALTGRRDQAATYARKNLTAAFTNWVEGYVKEHPDVQGLYNRTVKIELEAGGGGSGGGSATAAAATQAPAAVAAPARAAPAEAARSGLVTPGNIDIHNRPVVHNKDGTISTVRSITITDDQGRAILIPTVSDDGKILSNKDAIALYQKTGRHLGIFRSEAAADSYASDLHNQQAQEYSR